MPRTLTFSETQVPAYPFLQFQGIKRGPEPRRTRPSRLVWVWLRCVFRLLPSLVHHNLTDRNLRRVRNQGAQVAFLYPLSDSPVGLFRAGLVLVDADGKERATSSVHHMVMHEPLDLAENVFQQALLVDHPHHLARIGHALVAP